MKMRGCMSFPAMPSINWSAFTFEAPAWLSNCLGFIPGAAQQDFVFDGYQTDEFDHLLSTDPSSRSFLSRLPFKRGSNRQLRRAATQDSSTDESLRSLLIDDRDAELFGDDSINMLLTTNAMDTTESDLPLGHRPSDVPDETELAREEEALRIAEEEEIERNRQRARKLAAEKGLIRSGTYASLASAKSLQSSGSGNKTRSSRSTSVKSQMSMVSIPASGQGQDETAPGILPHMRPS